MKRRDCLDDLTPRQLPVTCGRKTARFPDRKAPRSTNAKPASRPKPDRSRVAACLRAVRLGLVACAALGALSIGAWGGLLVYDWWNEAQRPRAEMVRAVVERIIQAESRGDPNAKNPRSSALGAAQFIDSTWLEMIRKHRSDLRVHSETEILELRRDPVLVREITTRFVERNATKLHKLGLPITPGTLYLCHFAGGAGAAAILNAAEDADAAFTMAAADSTKRTTRDELVRANPFLQGITAGGLKKWADRKMIPSSERQTERRS